MALFDELTRSGARVSTDRSQGYVVGQGREATPHQARAVWYVIEDSQLYSIIARYPTATVLAVSHPLPPQQFAQLVTLQGRLADALTAKGRQNLVARLGDPLVPLLIPADQNVSPASLITLAKLNLRVRQHVCLCSVIAFPSSEVPHALRPPPGG
jgi:hypothetical protein